MDQSSTTLAWIAIIVPTIGALTAAIVSIITAIRSKDNGIKADKIIEKATEIKISTDGNLSRMGSDLETAKEKITGLENLIRSMAESTRAAGELARNPVPVATVVIQPPVGEIVKPIDLLVEPKA